ncbi:MAG: hypothetical protein QM758_11230 [Armatimonas sp.]
MTDLRQALGSDGDVLLSPTLSTLRLDTTTCDIDVLRFDAAPQRQWMLYRGELLEGCREEWVYPERQARQASYLSAREVLTRKRVTLPKQSSIWRPCCV